MELSSSSIEYTLKRPKNFEIDKRMGHRYTARHEFFHTLGYAHDEYKYDLVDETLNEYFGDTHSLMNLDSQVRSRHLTTFMLTLNTMIRMNGSVSDYKKLELKLVE